METKPVVDGVIEVTKEEYEAYIKSPQRTNLMRRAGMTQLEIDKRLNDMLAGRTLVTYHKAVVQVQQ